MKTTVDYLRFRARGTVLEGLEALRGTFGPYGPSLGLKGGLKAVSYTHLTLPTIYSV